MKKNVTVVLGGQAGSEGKGKFAGYLALKDRFDIAICNFMPNAGHTWVGDDGEKVMVQQLPQAVIDGTSHLVISAGAAIDPIILEKELDKYADYGTWDRLLIHPRAMVVNHKHVAIESSSLHAISSTVKGCGAASADKIMRSADTILAKDHPFLAQFVVHDLTKQLHYLIDQGAQVLVEGPQGYDLDVNHGLEYPYCTSRQTTSAQQIADAGLPPQSVKEVIAVIRPYPIRVGDAFDSKGNKIGTSGTYLDSPEISWETVALRSGTPIETISEYTTVTGKLRRVFEPHWDRLREMVQTNGVTQIALNFANYVDYEVYGATRTSQITPKVWRFIEMIEDEVRVPVTLIGTGPNNSHIIDLRKKAK